MDDVNGARAAGQRAALITSAIGLALAALIAAGFGLTTFLRSTSGWVVLIVAVVGVLGFARTAGGRVGIAIKNGGNPWLLGVGLALATIVVPTVVISLASWAVQQGANGASRMVTELSSYVLKPLFWVVSVGALPACALGLLYARLVRRTSAAEPR